MIAAPPPRANPMAVTLLVLTGMLVMGAGGFGLGRYVLAKRLKPSEVHASRPIPIRILTPDEARSVAKDEPSPVWTEGVKDSDIPKMEPAAPTTDKPRHRRHAPAPAKPGQPAPDATAPPTGTPPAPPAPSGDTTDIPND